MKKNIQKLLNKLNNEYIKTHHEYEKFFWISYMGDHSIDKKMEDAKNKRDIFRANRKYVSEIDASYKAATNKEKMRLNYWKDFFNKYQIPEKVLSLKQRIDKLETRIHANFAHQVEGYVDPKSKKFVKASINKMRGLIRTHENESLRKACFEALEKLAVKYAADYVMLVKLRNKFAQKLGFDDFYAYKLDLEEGMTKQELFKIFDEIQNKTKYAFKNIKKLETQKPKLRYPWNFGYMMAGDFAQEDNPYFQFEEALTRWGQSFSALGVDFRSSKLQLDLLDRKGKYNNGFCHWPDLIFYKDGIRQTGSANFTCNVIMGQVGSGVQGMVTLFHEGGHAAHYLNADMQDTCLHSEYPPASTAWAETQSMFMDTLFSSIEWKTRYAKNDSGKTYPFDLFAKKVKRLHVLAPLDMNGILFVSNFEKQIYGTKNLTSTKVKKIAKNTYKEFFNYKVDSYLALNIPHIYSWESACSYHGYGLATLAVSQWREYLYKKYGYLVDNPNIYKEMVKVWRLGSAKKFQALVKQATKKKLSAKPYLEVVTRDLDLVIKQAKQKLARMKRVPKYKKKIKLNAEIKMVHGKKIIADNKISYEKMAEKYKKWLSNNN